MSSLPGPGKKGLCNCRQARKKGTVSSPATYMSPSGGLLPAKEPPCVSQPPGQARLPPEWHHSQEVFVGSPVTRLCVG